jgi:branched-chain amino acid transport system permease protein
MVLGQALVNWLLLGTLYAAVALGFSLVWGIMNIVNLAHGALIVLGAYVALVAFQTYHLDPFPAILIAMVVLFLVGWVVQYVAINRVIRAPFLVTFMLTFGLDLLATDLIQQHFGGDTRSINTVYSGIGLTFGSTHIAFDHVAAAVIAILLTVALSLFLGRTRTGNAILATGMDRDAASLMGISIRRTYALTFAIGAALAGAAGAMLAQFYPFFPSQGGSFTLTAFVIVVLGGLGTPWAALAGGMVFGLAETFVPLIPHVGPGYNNAIAFALLVLVLIFRPRGILGKAFYS